MTNKDLGMVTAYAYAVSKGYAGTEDEFATLMASYADVGQTAVDAALAAKASEDAAKVSETASATSATEAEGFATNASTSAGNAFQAAQNASQSATAASGSATSAAGLATAAAGSATTAGNKAGEAAQSATAAAGSATTAGTAATAAQTAQTAAETAQTAAEAAQAAAEAAAQTLVIDPTLTQANQAAEAKATGDAIGLVKSHLEATYITDSASGAIASFPDGADGIPVEGLTVAIEPTQSGSGDPSPENVRPISGRTAVDIYKSKYNFLDPTILLQASGWALSTDEGFETYKGVPVYKGMSRALYNKFRDSNAIPLSVDPSKQYVVMCWWRSVAEHTQQGIRFILYYSDGTSELTPGQSANQEWKKRIITSAEGKSLVAIGFSYNSDYQIYLAGFACLDSEQYLAMGDARVDYVSPGDRTAVTVQLGQTVYDGSLDVTTGVLTVDWESANLGNLTWILQSDSVGPYFRTSANRVLRIPTGEGISPMMCSNYPTVSSSNVVDKSIARSQGSTDYIYLRDTTYETVEAFKAAMDGVMLVYPVKNAYIQTVQLTAQQISTLLGQNNVWSDAGDVSVDYVADTKLYIEQLTEPDADMIADANITSGSYFMVGNQLFLATANIASGAAITPGVNCTRTSLAEALNAINA